MPYCDFKTFIYRRYDLHSPYLRYEYPEWRRVTGDIWDFFNGECGADDGLDAHKYCSCKKHNVKLSRLLQVGLSDLLCDL